MYDILVIGAGPAGLTSAIYTARAGLKTAVIEKLTPGGQIVNTHSLENYPGFPEGISGADFSLACKQQAERFGAEIISDEILATKLDGKVKEVTGKNGVYQARCVILAMGARPRKLGIEGEEELMGAGVSYCATCDGAFFKGRDVAVVGGGDTAIEDALYLSGLVNKVYLIHRRQEFRAQQRTVSRLKEKKNVEYVLDSGVTKLHGVLDLESITVENKVTGAQRDIKVDGLFVAVGRVPDTACVADGVTLDEAGYVVPVQSVRTSVDGVFVAGDVRQTPLRQVATAVGDGAIAALLAGEYVAF